MSHDLLQHAPCTGTVQSWHQFGRKYGVEVLVKTGLSLSQMLYNLLFRFTLILLRDFMTKNKLIFAFSLQTKNDIKVANEFDIYV